MDELALTVWEFLTTRPSPELSRWLLVVTGLIAVAIIGNILGEIRDSVRDAQIDIIRRTKRTIIKDYLADTHTPHEENEYLKWLAEQERRLADNNESD